MLAGVLLFLDLLLKYGHASAPLLKLERLHFLQKMRHGHHHMMAEMLLQKCVTLCNLACIFYVLLPSLHQPTTEVLWLPDVCNIDSQLKT